MGSSFCPNCAFSQSPDLYIISKPDRLLSNNSAISRANKQSHCMRRYLFLISPMRQTMCTDKRYGKSSSSSSQIPGPNKKWCMHTENESQWIHRTFWNTEYYLLVETLLKRRVPHEFFSRDLWRLKITIPWFFLPLGHLCGFINYMIFCYLLHYMQNPKIKKAVYCALL